MIRHTALTAAFALATRIAVAQPGAAPPPSAPPLPPAASPAVTAPTESAPAVDRPVAGGCILGTHHGVDENDATTAAEMVCAKLRSAGAPTDRGYRIRIRKLGHNMFLVAEATQGDRVVDSSELQISNIEEVTVAAPRLAQALTTGKSVEETATATNAVGGENKKVKKRNSGQMRGGIGIGALFIPGANVGGAVGSVPIWYETDQFSAGMRIRLGLVEAGLFGAEVAGRYLPVKGDTSPFIGAGLGGYVLWMTGTKTYDTTTGSYVPGGYNGVRFGAVPNVEIGMSFMRSQSVSLDVGFRADLPTFAIDKNSPYVVPLSLTAELKF